MSATERLLWLFYLAFIDVAYNITQRSYIITLNKQIQGSGIKCSTGVEYFDWARLVYFLNQDGIVGVHKKNSTAAHICYWNRNGNDLVPHETLSGGDTYMFGN